MRRPSLTLARGLGAVIILMCVLPAAAAAAPGAGHPLWGTPTPLAGGSPHTAAQEPSGTVHAASAAQTQQSTNWSGYISTGATFGGVSAEWTVPTVTASGPAGYSSTWIGIDGTGSNDPALIQTGTEQDTAGGQTSYYAWYELLPAPEQVIGGVEPGDVMKASITEPSPGTWTIDIADLTSNQSATGSGSYDSPGDSAEWIEEAPTGESGDVEPLADFQTVTFTDMTVQGATLADTTLTPVQLVNQSGTIIAYPGPVEDNSSFTVTAGSPNGSTPPTTTPPTTTPPTTSPPTTSPPTTTPPTCPALTPAALTGRAVGLAAMAAGGCRGYWVASATGDVVSIGAATPYGDFAANPTDPVVGLAATSDGKGYWLVTRDGAVYPFGDAISYGDHRAAPLAAPIVSMAATADGKGYWLLGSDGGIFTYGDAKFYGSTGAMHLNKPVVGLAEAPGGTGYWLVAADGGIFNYGSATFEGSTGAMHLNQPVVGMTASPTGVGYRLVAADGGIFSFGAPFYGSLGASPPPTPVVAMSPSIGGNGYYMVDAGGDVYGFGDAAIN
jgi:hypothetical protein